MPREIDPFASPIAQMPGTLVRSCCWALMLLMFAVGTGNVGWMLVLGAVMAIDKNVPWGSRLSIATDASSQAAMTTTVSA